MAIAAAIRTTYSLDARIKVPNDVRIERKKVAGVLTELAYDAEDHPFFVLGFGVNVNNASEDFPPELRGTATSVRMAHPFSENRNFGNLSCLAIMRYSLPPGKALSATEGGGDGFNYE